MASSANHLCCSGESKSNTSEFPYRKETSSKPLLKFVPEQSQLPLQAVSSRLHVQSCKPDRNQKVLAALSWKWGKEKGCSHFNLAGSHGSPGLVQPLHTGPSAGSCGCSHQQAEVEIQLGGTPVLGGLAHRSLGEERLQTALVLGSAVGFGQAGTSAISD